MLNAQLKTELASLSLQEKLEVFEIIRANIMPPSERGFPELTESQHAELLRRATVAASNPSAGRSWADVKQRLEK